MAMSVDIVAFKVFLREQIALAEMWNSEYRKAGLDGHLFFDFDNPSIQIGGVGVEVYDANREACVRMVLHPRPMNLLLEDFEREYSGFAVYKIHESMLVGNHEIEGLFNKFKWQSAISEAFGKVDDDYYESTLLHDIENEPDDGTILAIALLCGNVPSPNEVHYFTEMLKDAVKMYPELSEPTTALKNKVQVLATVTGIDAHTVAYIMDKDESLRNVVE